MDSIELLVDDATDAAIRADWAALEAADLPNAGRTASETNRPHVTLVAAPGIPDDADARLASLAAGLPLPLRLAGYVVFDSPTTCVLSRLVTVSAELVELQRAAHGLVAPLAPPVDTSAPGAWTPHLTLARRLPHERLGEALAALAEHRMPESASFPRLRRWDSAARVVTELVDP